MEFDLDRDIDEAANDIRDRVGRVVSSLPEEADPPEISKADANAEPIIFVNLSSETLGSLELTDYAERYVVDRFAALPGVARVRLTGDRRYAMRVWIDRTALAARALTVTDVEAALRKENVQIPAGPHRVAAARVRAEHRDRLRDARGLPQPRHRPRRRMATS